MIHPYSGERSDYDQKLTRLVIDIVENFQSGIFQILCLMSRNHNRVYRKKLTKDHELLLYLNSQLIYKLWLTNGQTKIFDTSEYEKYNSIKYSDLVIEDPKLFITVKAEVRFKRTDEGGRINGIFSGYSPNHVFEYKVKDEMFETYMGDFQFSEPVKLELGKEYQVFVRFPLFQRIERFLNLERKWWIHEGARVVGEAQITSFKHSDSEKNK